MNTIHEYDHELTYVWREDAEEASDWVQQHLDLTNRASAADCAIVERGMFSVCAFSTKQALSCADMMCVLQECRPQAGSWNTVREIKE